MSARHTPLHDAHLAAGGRLVEFAGFDMPVQYRGVLEEHRCVRERAGLFDVSHMGEVELRGSRALEAVQWLVCGDVRGVVDGQALYTGMLNPRGGFVDDLIVYRHSPERFFLVINAANRPKDVAWIQEQVRHAAGDDARAEDVGDAYAQIAFQGPRAREIAARVASIPVDSEHLPFFRFVQGQICGRDTLIAATGYTGEDGFEFYCAPADAPAIWGGLLEAGRDHDVQPCGLGARDTLRLESKLMLYGNDIDDDHSPLEASLGWIVSWDKGEFCGHAALLAQKTQGIPRKLVGFEMLERGIPRHGYPVVDKAGQSIGIITSGTQSPTLGKPIALGYVPAALSKLGTEHRVEIRGKPVAARVIKTPFYKR
ncbi:MAG: glycine cleavage system aminomethyltransferase GcvT [Pseudomonadota bacterium]